MGLQEGGGDVEALGEFAAAGRAVENERAQDCNTDAVAEDIDGSFYVLGERRGGGLWLAWGSLCAQSATSCARERRNQSLRNPDSPGRQPALGALRWGNRTGDAIKDPMLPLVTLEFGGRRDFAPVAR